MSLWFKQAPSCGSKENKNRDCSALGRFLRETPDLEQVVTSLAVGSRHLPLPSRPLQEACWVCESCFFVWFHGRCDYCCFISVDCWNKALERFLVFTGAQRRPRQDRSSGGGDRRGPPWGSLASGPAHSPRRCLWWTDGPCSSWLL